MISVETCAIRRVALRMLASCELSFRSGSKGASMETPVRSISIGWVFLRQEPQHVDHLFRQRPRGGDLHSKAVEFSMVGS